MTVRGAPEVAHLYRPHAIAASTGWADSRHVDVLFPDELPGTETMGAGRLAEFATGRACARQALRAIGAGDTPIPRAGRRVPVWPEGTTGSISHIQGWCVAVAATLGPVAAIGIDVEEVERVRPAVAKRVLTPTELEAIADASEADQQLATAIAFSAKEAFYKAHYQLDPRFIGFDVVHVERLDDEQFRFHPASPELSAEVVARATGRLSITDGRVTTAVAIET